MILRVYDGGYNGLPRLECTCFQPAQCDGESSVIDAIAQSSRIERTIRNCLDDVMRGRYGSFVHDDSCVLGQAGLRYLWRRRLSKPFKGEDWD